MDNRIHIYYSKIENAEESFRDYLVDQRVQSIFYDDLNEFKVLSSLQTQDLNFKEINDYILFKTRECNKLISIRNELRKLIESNQQEQNLSQLNQIILDVIQPKNQNIDLLNPFIETLENEINNQYFFNDRGYILIISNPNDEDFVLKVFTRDEKEFAAFKICNLIVEYQNDDELISNLDEIISLESIDVLESIQIPIKKHINTYNNSLLKSKINELLEEYWDIDYKIVFNIENIESKISENEILSKLYHQQGCRIKVNSIEISLNSNEDILGSQINPLDNNCQMNLTNRLNTIVWNNISINYEDEIIQHLNELSENTDIKVINFEYPNVDDLRDYYQKYF